MQFPLAQILFLSFVCFYSHVAVCEKEPCLAAEAVESDKAKVIVPSSTCWSCHLPLIPRRKVPGRIYKCDHAKNYCKKCTDRQLKNGFRSCMACYKDFHRWNRHVRAVRRKIDYSELDSIKERMEDREAHKVERANKRWDFLQQHPQIVERKKAYYATRLDLIEKEQREKRHEVLEKFKEQEKKDNQFVRRNYLRLKERVRGTKYVAKKLNIEPEIDLPEEDDFRPF